MRKYILVLSFVCVLLGASLLFVACGGNYTITVYPNNGAAATTIDDIASLRDFANDGYTLAGYYLDADFTQQTTMHDIKTRSQNQNVKVYLRWEEAQPEVCRHELVVLPAVAATCTQTGLTEGARCAICQEVVVPQEVTRALGHDRVAHDAKAVSCTEDGWAAYDTCTRCDYTSFVLIEAQGHHEGGWVEEQAATCTTAGLEQTMCTVCGMVMQTRVMRAYSHDYREQIVSQPTCTEVGYSRYTCARCNDEYLQETPALGHYVVEHAAKPATCTIDGYLAYQTCRRCNYTTYTVEHSVGHTPSGWTVVNEPTCTVGGLRQNTCTVCADVIASETTPALGHNYLSHDGLAPTCISYGYTAYRTCTRCDYNDREDLPLGPHRAAEWELTTPATCTQDGEMTSKCAVCSVLMDTRVVVASGHNYLSHDGQAPTCTEAGHTAYRSCTRCDFDDRTVIPATGHTEGDWTLVSASTCTEKGSESRYCTVCSAELATREIDFAPHTAGEWQTDVWATCTTTGHQFTECVVCQSILEERTLAVLDHDYVWHDALAPTCTEAGYAAYRTCARCDYDEYAALPATGHSEGEWTVVLDATCSAVGQEVVCCTVCHAELSSREIATLPHTPDEWVVERAASCVQEGFEYVECVVCHTLLEELVLSPLGHDYVSHEGLEPTCTEAGYKAYRTCTRCDYDDIELLPATGHVGEWTTQRLPTCTEAGERYIVCTVCDEEYGREPIAVLGHDYVWHEGVSATCTEDGYADYNTCTRCDYSDYTAIAAVGHSAMEVSLVAPTCTETGSSKSICAVCGEQLGTYVVPATGHVEGEWEITAEATCTEQGARRRLCTVCSALLASEVVEALGHDYVATAHEATCQTLAYVDYLCARCGDAYTATSQSEPLASHRYEGRLCVWCGSSALWDYDATFRQVLVGNTRDNPYVTHADGNFDTYQMAALFLDWVLLHIDTIDIDVYFKLDVEMTQSDFFNEALYDLSYYSYYSDSTYLGTYPALQVFCINVTSWLGKYDTIYPSDTDIDGVCYTFTPVEKQESPQYTTYMAPVGTPRADDFDDFPYYSRTHAIEVRTPSQLFFAFESGYLPQPVQGSKAETVLNEAKAILRQIITDEMSELQKLAAIYQWFVNEVHYDYSILDNARYSKSSSCCTSFYADGPILYRVGVCDGIAQAVCIFAGIEDIRCVRICGYTVKHESGHAWNAVWVDADHDGTDEWYLMDCTWAISGATLSGTKIVIRNYSYFLFTTTQREGDGFLRSQITAPDIVATTIVNTYQSFYYTIAADEMVDYRFDSQAELNDYFLTIMTQMQSHSTMTCVVDISISFAQSKDAAVSAVQTALAQYTAYGGTSSRFAALAKMIVGLNEMHITVLVY